MYTDEMYDILDGLDDTFKEFSEIEYFDYGDFEDDWKSFMVPEMFTPKRSGVIENVSLSYFKFPNTTEIQYPSNEDTRQHLARMRFSSDHCLSYIQFRVQSCPLPTKSSWGAMELGRRSAGMAAVMGAVHHHLLPVSLIHGCRTNAPPPHSSQ